MRQVFEIVPASGGAIPFFALMIAIPILLLGLFGFLWHSMHNTTFEVSGEGIRIRGDLYGRTIPLSKLRLDQARVLDISHDPDHGLSWRTNGVGMPGYASGWFRLKNGEKALVFLTRRNRILYVPTVENYALLVSPKDPNGLLAALQTNGGSK
jgi:hypothetical protein